MNYIQNYLLSTNNVQGIKPGTQKEIPQTEQKNVQQDVNITSLPNVQPDYNVKVPMTYTQLEDIKLNDELSAKCYKLANGQKVIIVPKDGTTMVKTYVNTGSFNETDDIRGISHYIEHNLFNGSEALGDEVFFDEVNKMGAHTNASTSFAETNYFISSNLLEDTDLENKIRLHAGMLTSPKFLIDKLEKEKKIVNSEINMYMGEDFSIGETQMIKNLFNVKSSSLDLVAGTTDNITKLNRDDVVNYFNNNYYPANMVTVITGEVNPDETMKLISKYFNTPNKTSGQRHFEELKPLENTIRQDIISPKSDGAASVFIGFAGPENNNYKEKLLVRALNELAGGLIYSKTAPITTKYGSDISFGVERLSSRPQDPGIIEIMSEVPEDKVEPFLKDLYKIVDNLAKVPATEDELSAIKNRLKKSHEKTYENSAALNNTLGHAFLNGVENNVQDFEKIIDSITAEDLMNTAKKYINLNKASLTVVHPNSATAEGIKSNFIKTSAANNVSFTGSNKKTPIDANAISTYKLHNNFELTFNDTKSNNVEFRMELNEKTWTPKQAATAAVLSGMLDYSGTSTKSNEEVCRYLDTNGISLITGVEDYGLSLKANFPAENASKALPMFNEVLLDAKLDEKLFKETIDRLRNTYSTSEATAFDKFDAVMYKGLPGQYNAKDKLASLDKITLDDVKNFYKEIFEQGQGTVVVSAPFSKHPELKQEIFNSIGKYSTVKPKDVTIPNSFKPIDKTEVLTSANNKNQAEIVEGFKFKQNGNLKDRTTLNVLNTILGGTASSRLFSDLRETRHLAYSVDSHIDYTDDIGVMQLYIKTTTENLETGEKSFDNLNKAINGFNENIEKIKTQKVSEEELEAAKKHLKTDLLVFLETNYGKTEAIEAGIQSYYGATEPNQILEAIDKVTADDIYAAANYIFKEKPVYSMTATQATLDANKEFLDSLAK
ncbi:MAG: insulinase family protein [Muribaculaceae bacterium]|nr:insulinase family protein [Muribaculaceae bacterium]